MRVVDLFRDEGARDARGDPARDRRRRVGGGHGEISARIAVAPPKVLRSLASDENEPDLSGPGRQELLGAAQEIRVVAATEAAIARHDHEEGAVLRPRRGQERMRVRLDAAHEMLHHDLELVRIGTSRHGGLLSASQLRRRDHLHGLGDLLRILDGGDPLPDRLEARHYLPNPFLKSSIAARTRASRSSSSWRFSRVSFSTAGCFASMKENNSRSKVAI